MSKDNIPAPNSMLNAAAREELGKLFRGEESKGAPTAQTTPVEQPAKGDSAPVEDKAASTQTQDSKGQVTGDWRQKIPAQYHAVFEGLDDQARGKILDVVANLDKPRQADYTKKTQALSAKEKELASKASQLQIFEGLAKEWGVPVEEVAKAAQGFAKLHSTPGAKVVIQGNTIWESPVKEPELPDFDKMTKAEVAAWHKQQLAREREALKNEVKAEVDKELEPVRQQEQSRKNAETLSQLKAARTDVADEEWGEAIELARQSIALYMQGGSSVDDLGNFLNPFLLATRANKAAKAAGLQVKSEEPKTTSIDAPISHGKPPSKEINSWRDAVDDFKRTKGIRNLGARLREES